MLAAGNAAVLRRNISASWILWLFRLPIVNLIVADRGYSSVLALLTAASHKAAANTQENKGQKNGSDHGTDGGDD